MNILLFVMSILMLLVMITYGRIESFKNDAFIQAQFEDYMENSERVYINETAIKHYRDTSATRLEKSEKAERKKSKASAKLSFNLFIDKEQRAENPLSLETHIHVAERLIELLYGDQLFYKELLAKRPNFVAEILSALIRESENSPKISKAEELATIDLKDPELNDAFTRMLKGAYEEPPKGKKEKRPYRLDSGYYSLLDFITVVPNKLKLRVYLASKQLLLAVYGNQLLVNDILRVRYQLYRDVIKNNMNADQASKEFKSLFGNLALPYVPADFLDFSVSKTNPNQYR